MTKMKELIEKLNKYTVAYDCGNPLISDKEWDDMYFELKELEEETGIVYPNSPTQTIHYEEVSELSKVEHSHSMLSLNKTKDINEIANFCKEAKDTLIMYKLDGLSCSLRYEQGVLVSAETRGDGKIGEDILHNALVIKNIPTRIPYNNTLVIDGEIICTYDDFERHSAGYKNPRNFASGSIRLLDSKECAKRDLTFIAWDVIQGLYDMKTLQSKLSFINQLGISVVPHILLPQFKEIETLNEVIEELNMSNNVVYHYPIDGYVVKYNNIEEGEKQGRTAHHFKNALAYKLYDEEYESQLIDIEWTMGRTGVLTPVAIFEPIDIDGTEVSRASLHNISVMQSILGQPYVGQKVQVAKMNMIIPQITKAERPTDPQDVQYLTPPNSCPVCGKATDYQMINESVQLICINPECEGKALHRFVHFCSKKGLDIKGLSEATLEKLMDWGWIVELEDIFKLSKYKNEWMKKSGFGEKSVEKILSAIETAKNTTLEKFISSLGIPLIGVNVAKELCKYLLSYEDFRKKIKNKYDFSMIDGFGYAKADALLSFDYFEADCVYDHLNINSIEMKVENNNDSTPLAGLTFVVTGKVNRFKNRAELQSFIESLGGKVSSSISSKTNYLINNDVNSTSSKNLKAKQLNIPIITEEEFIIGDFNNGGK